MKRDWHYKPGWEFNSEDSVEHLWGDFVVVATLEEVTLKLDGRIFEIRIQNPNTLYLAIHRDSYGQIDHLVEIHNNWLECCECCGETNIKTAIR